MRILRLLIPHDHQVDHCHQLKRGIAPEEPNDVDRLSECLHMHFHMPASTPNLLHLLLHISRSSLTTKGTDEESATVEPQSRVSDRSQSPQGQSPQNKKERKPIAETRKPSELPKAKKCSDQ